MTERKKHKGFKKYFKDKRRKFSSRYPLSFNCPPIKVPTLKNGELKRRFFCVMAPAGIRSLGYAFKPRKILYSLCRKSA